MTTCGIRFLHPVWFIPPVEISSEEVQRPVELAAIWEECVGLGLEPFYMSTKGLNGFGRRKLYQDEIDKYHQHRKATVSSSLRGGQAPAPRGSGSVGRECGICMEPSRVSMILSPCGHKDMCKECTNKIVSGTRTCPTCRRAVERVLEADSGAGP